MEQKQSLKKDGSVDRRTTRKANFLPGMFFDPTKAKRVEVIRSSAARPWKVYVYDCIKCGENEIRLNFGALSTSQGTCRSCAAKKRPYEYIFGALKASARIKKQPVSLTYEEFVEFISTEECHYCGSHIDWRPHAVGENYPKGYYLDRKDNALGYSKDNCVPCCTSCNFIRQDKLTHEEMNQLRPALEGIMRRRHLTELAKSVDATEFT
jgi:hypothetical protein